MFLYDFIQLEVPYEEVRSRIAEGGGRWLSALATETYVDNGSARVDVGPQGLPVRKEVAVELDAEYENDGFVRIPFRMRATGVPGLFPTLDGDIEITRLGPRTHLCVMGRYTPPMGAVGRVLDRMVLHHIAEGTLRSFLHRLADAFTLDAAATVNQTADGSAP